MDNFDSTVSTSVYATALITKLSVIPERYINIRSNSIPS